MYYAQIDLQTRICFAVTETAGEIIAPQMIELQSLDASLLGKCHNEATGEFDLPAPVALRVLSKLDYLKRFTQAERIAIRTLGQTNDTVNDYIELMNAAVVVRLDDPDTVGGVNALESAGALAVGRAAEILA